jgi:hypothetical protein
MAHLRTRYASNDTRRLFSAKGDSYGRERLFPGQFALLRGILYCVPGSE